MTSLEITTHQGSCLCGAVRLEIRGELRPPDACHCVQCRKHSGHVWASTDISRDALTVHGAQEVSWFSSSAKFRRGFCRVCGSTLFWDPIGHPTIAVSMGVLDAPTRVTLAKHIFVSQKGDYYVIDDGLEQNER